MLINLLVTNKMPLLREFCQRPLQEPLGTFRCVCMSYIGQLNAGIKTPLSIMGGQQHSTLMLISPIVSSSDAVKLLLARGVPQHQPHRGAVVGSDHLLQEVDPDGFLIR